MRESEFVFQIPFCSTFFFFYNIITATIDPGSLFCVCVADTVGERVDYSRETNVMVLVVVSGISRPSTFFPAVNIED